MAEALQAHRVARCCWCGGGLYWHGGHWWCGTQACRLRQVAWSVWVRGKGGKGRVTYLYVPTPKQVVFEEARRPGASDGEAFNVLFGGAAGPGKSHGGRWSMYRKALTLPGYEGLLLRETFPELEKTHLRKMAREEEVLRRAGVEVSFTPSSRTMRLRGRPEWPWSLIECGHMSDEGAVSKYLSTEYDDIVPDEASRFPPGPLLELSTRVRSTKPEVLAAGGPWFRPVTNPGGPSSAMLTAFFVDHAPDFDQFAEVFRAVYDSGLWVYIEARLEDNPYQAPGYEATLARLSGARYQQLRHGDWHANPGQFFTGWRATRDGRPWHVQRLGLDGGSVDWFRSMDWGRSKPGCVLWWACLPDGHLHLGAELKFVDTDVRDVVRQMHAIDRELGVSVLRYTVSDPALFNRSQETGPSIAETFSRAGVYLRRGNNNRLNGWERCRQLLAAAPDGTPWLTVDPRCRYFIRSIPALQQDAHDPEDVDTTMDDHAADAWRYGAMSRPGPTAVMKPDWPAGAIGRDVEALREAAVRV